VEAPAGIRNVFSQVIEFNNGAPLLNSITQYKVFINQLFVNARVKVARRYIYF
jgi:hypothetical protein